MRFHPAEVSTLLQSLTRAVATDPEAVITVTADRDQEGKTADGWAWNVGTGAALDTTAAAAVRNPCHAARRRVRLHPLGRCNLVDLSTDGLSATALTDDVKTVITAHGETSQPTNNASPSAGPTTPN
ncbi:hypothetical protein ABZ070_25925 [Streptomyces sp. NPDC006283]|uniref:hypothetical protein n=1 Tax=Streptomyces sp. NPDC006283 TaxID=3156741 RepID=UPI0033A1053C